MWFLILFGIVCLVMLALAWGAASPSRDSRGDSSTPYFGDITSGEHQHHHTPDCGHGHDGGGDSGGGDSGGDGGGGDGGGGSD